MTGILIIWDLAAAVLWVRAMWRAVGRPTGDYGARWAGKLGAVAAVLVLWLNFAHVFLPLGAIAALVYFRRSGRRRVGSGVPLAHHWPGDHRD